MLRLPEVSKVLVYSTNFDKELRNRLMAYAKSQYPKAGCFGRTNAIFNPYDLEAADVVIVSSVDKTIAEAYRERMPSVHVIVRDGASDPVVEKSVPEPAAPPLVVTAIEEVEEVPEEFKPKKGETPYEARKRQRMLRKHRKQQAKTA